MWARRAHASRGARTQISNSCHVLRMCVKDRAPVYIYRLLSCIREYTPMNIRRWVADYCRRWPKRGAGIRVRFRWINEAYRIETRLTDVSTEPARSEVRHGRSPKAVRPNLVSRLGYCALFQALSCVFRACVFSLKYSLYRSFNHQWNYQTTKRTENNLK